MSDLIINGKDAFQEWGVRMGDGFLDVIDAPLPMKEFIENESGLEHGKRVLTTNAKIDSRELTLAFTIEGSSKSDYRAKKKAFEAELYKGNVNITIPALGADIYKLIYRGKSVSYGMNLSRTFGKISSKFEEPNPADRNNSVK